MSVLFKLLKMMHLHFWAFPTLHFHVVFLVYVGMVLVPVPDDTLEQLVKGGIAEDDYNWAVHMSAVMDILHSHNFPRTQYR